MQIVDTIEVTCSTTNRTCDAQPCDVQRGHGRLYIWWRCVYCDTQRRTWPDPAYDPEQPQIHCHVMEEPQC